MAIPSYEGVAYNTAFASSNTVDISGIDGGSPPTVGDLLIAQICLPNTSATTNEFIYPPDGWHILGGYINGSRDVVFWKIRESGDSNSVQFSYPGIGTLNSIAYIHCIRGADKARPIARHSVNYQDSGTYDWLAETTPVADCLAIASANLVEANRTGASAASGWTERLDVGIGILLDEVTSYVQTKGIASASTSSGNPSTDIPGLGSNAYNAHMMLIQPPQTATPKDVRVATGSLTSPTSTGNQDITGLGFDCKALIIYGIRSNSTSVATDIEYTHGIGADDGVTSAAQRSFGVWHDSGSGCAGYSRNGEIVALYVAGNSTVGSPDLLATFSRITDGFRLNWSAVMGTGYTFNYIAFGGSDVEAAVGAVACSAGAVSGLNFRPDAVHIIGQCLDTDSDQLRTAAGIGNCGWLDCQSGAQFYSFVGTEETGQPDFIYRHTGIYGQTSSGTPNYEISFEQTTSSGWTWVGTDSDYLFYLALSFGGTTYFPYQVETLVGDDSGTPGADQYLPSFGLDQTYGTKKLIHSLVNRDGTDVGIEAGGYSEGHVKFSYVAVDQDGMALGKSGSTSERRRATFQALPVHSSGDLNSYGKYGRFYYPDYIDWAVNNSVEHLIGLFTLGFIGQVYTRTINDTASVSDSVETEMEFGRTATDSASVSDSVAAVMEFDRIDISDSASVTDSISRAWVANRTLSDSVSTTYQIVTELEYAVDLSDSVSTSDSAATGMEFGRTSTDSVSTADSTERSWEANRTIEDNPSVSDQAFTSLDYKRTASDSVSTADQIDRSWEANRTLSDSASMSDQLAVELVFERSSSDSVSVSDQANRAVCYCRPALDSVSTTDQIVRSWEANRAISDNPSTYDYAQRSWEADRTQSDFVVTTDTKTTNRTFERTASDSVSTADQITANLESDRSASDTVSTTDQILRVFDAVRSISDSVNTNDDLFVEVQGSKQDSVSTSDNLSTSLEYSRTIDDFAVTTDTAKTSLEFSRSAGDSASVTDSVATELELGANISDSVSTTDQIERVFDCVRTISDSEVASDVLFVEVQTDGGTMVGVMDQLYVSMTFERLVQNWVVPYDTFDASLERSYVISDTINASDESIAIEMSYGRTVSDSASVSDSLSTEFEEGQIKREISDSVSIADQATTGLSYERSANDSISTADQVSIDTALNVELSDSVSTADQIARAWEANRTLTDSPSVSDQASAGIFDYTISDSATAADSVSVELEYSKSIADTTSVSDQIQVKLSGAYQITITESISLSDQISRSHDSSRTIGDFVNTSDGQGSTVEIAPSDSVSVSDQLSKITDFDRTISDSATVAEQFTREYDAQRTISDSPEVSDTIDVSIGGIISLSDAVTTAEQLAVEISFGRVLSDSATVAEQLVVSLEKIFDITIDDSATVTEQLVKEQQTLRTISDSVSLVDSLQYQAPSFDVKIYDSISTADEINASLEKIGSIQDTADTSDSIAVVLVLGGYASDSLNVSDAISADLLFVPPDLIDVEDELSREVQYNRSLSDAVEVEDYSYSGEPILVIHGIEDGTNYGDSQIHTVNPTGPLSISGGRICSPVPTGFVENKGDVIEYNDSLIADMYYDLVINDSVETAG